MVLRGRDSEWNDSQRLSAGSHQAGRRGHHQGLSIQGFRGKGNVARAYHLGRESVRPVRSPGKSVRVMKHSMITAALAGALVWLAPAQEPSAQTAAPKPAPRMADGHPDLSG